MKNQIYILITIGLLIISSVSLIIYYIQDFNEEIILVESLNYDDIELETYERNGETFLSQARAEIGVLKLENKGYFSRKYLTPLLVGCLNLRENSQDKQLKIEISLKDDSEVYNNPYSRESRIIVPAEETKTLTINGDLMGGSKTSLSLFTKENIKGIEIYKIPKKEFNPFGDRYYSSNSNYFTCSQIESEFKPIQTIIIN